MTDVEKKIHENGMQAMSEFWNVLVSNCILTDEEWVTAGDCINTLCSFLPQENT